MSENTTYWYDATIVREGGKTKRQGTVGAKSSLEAMDIIVRLAKDHWHKPLTQVQLYEIEQGGTLAHVMTSTFGADYAMSAINAAAKSKKEEDDYSEYGMYSGFMHSYPDYSGENKGGFMSSSIGTYKGPESVALWKLTDT